MSKKRMEFTVAPKQMGEFAEVLVDNELKNQITGKDEDGDTLVMVEYGEDEKDAIYELIEITQGEEVDDPDGEESEEDDD